MEFKALCDLVCEEEFTTPILFILEDDDFRTRVATAYLNKYGLPLTIVQKDNCADAIAYVANNAAQIKWYSIDYNLRMGETTEKFALFLKNSGIKENLIIHSDDPSGKDVLKSILPSAKVAEIPHNITYISKNYE